MHVVNNEYTEKLKSYMDIEEAKVAFEDEIKNMVKNGLYVEKFERQYYVNGTKLKITRDFYEQFTDSLDNQ